MHMVCTIFTREYMQWAGFPSYWFDEALGVGQGWLQVMAGAVFDDLSGGPKRRSERSGGGCQRRIKSRFEGNVDNGSTE